MLVVLAGIYVLAADQVKDYGIGRTRTIELGAATRVGNALLPAGTYSVKHLMDGTSHILVFKAGRKEMARVNCTMVDLPEKANRTMHEYTTKGNERVLNWIAFSGEKFKHQF
jgi:hypothetical protein